MIGAPLRPSSRKQLNKRMQHAAHRLLPELWRMAALQQSKILTRLAHAPSRLVEAEADALVRARHRRRKARLQQKASRKANRS
jgi:phenylpropionate dioxygenase-like ring-hydroxylating dioxygenase large terminal subunit